MPAVEPGARGRTRRRLGRTLSASRWDEYRTLLERAFARRYRVASLEDWLLEPPDDDQRVLVLRHDVDQHPASVLAMLEVERDLGVASTWYFRWRTADRRVIEMVRRNGGSVGLHYETLTRRLLREPGLVVDERVLESCRDELRDEIAAFQQRFGPIRSVCPHGDSRVPRASNHGLLEGVALAPFGIELDGNHGLRGRRLAVWLTDRSAPEGRWRDGMDPLALLDRGVSPILCLTHPNNFAAGASLWLDRMLGAVLPAPRPGRRTLVTRTGGDDPPPRLAAPAPPASPFAPVADRLRQVVREHFEASGRPLGGAAGLNTLVTNSTFAERRTDMLLDVLFRHSELRSVSGLRVLDAGCGLGAMALVLASRGASVEAVDPNVPRLQVGAAVAREFGLPVTFRRAVMEPGAFDEAAFDLVVANNSLCYVVAREARRAALASLLSALRPGGWLVARNPNRLFPLDQFTGLPLLGLLDPAVANRLAARLGRRRSEVRLLTPWETRAELREAGFDQVTVTSATTEGVRGRLGTFARYHHAVARRPVA